MKAALFVLFAAVLAMPQPARADDTRDLEGLLDQSVVSGASKTAEAASVAPATTSIIGADELRRYGITRLDEALDFLSVGMVTERSSTSELGARGVLLDGDYGNHVLLLIDGHALNEQWDGAVYLDRGLGLPFELVDHIEVILGPGSVLYGSNAMQGVINIVTKRAKDIAGVHLVLESEIPNSIRGGLAVGKEFTALGHKGEVVAQLEYFGSSGPHFTYGPQTYGDDAVTGTPKNFGKTLGVWGGRTSEVPFSVVPSAYLKFLLGDFELDARAALYRRAAATGWGTFDDANNFEADRWVSLDARYVARLTPIAQLTVRGYFDYYDYQQNAPSNAAEDCLDGQLFGCTYRLDGAAKWGGIEASSTLDWFKNGRLVTLIGLDGRLKSFSSKEQYIDALTGVAPPGDSYQHLEGALGAYIQQTGQPFSWLNVNLGGRLDVDQRFGWHISPRAAVVASPWMGGAIKALYSEAFRAPTAFETYYNDPKGQIGAPKLQPEMVRSVEASVEQRLGQHHLLVGVFRTWWRDLVFLDNATSDEIAAAQARGELDASVSTASIYRNTSAVDSYGLNVAYDAAIWQRLRLGLNLTLAHTQMALGDGSPAVALNAAGQLFGNARISYDFGEGLPTVALVARYIGRRPVSGTSFSPIPDVPALGQFRLTVSGDLPLIAGLSYRLVGTYSTTNQTPFATGPLRTPTDTNPEQEVRQQARYSLVLGFQYDIQ